MKTTTIEVAGFASAVTALRLPFGLPMRSEPTISLGSDENLSSYKYKSFGQSTFVAIHPKDLALMQTLVKRGDEHAKVIRGIIAYAEIIAPIYWWCELETYRAGHERLASASTMHIDCKGLSGDALVQAKASIPMGKELKKVDFFSYQCLRNIVKQRKNHRLPEWNEFISWIWTLPFANELIFVGENND